MEEETRIVFKGKLKDFEAWLGIMKKRYSDASIECVLEDFKGHFQNKE